MPIQRRHVPIFGFGTTHGLVVFGNCLTALLLRTLATEKAWRGFSNHRGLHGNFASAARIDPRTYTAA
jgi:hypothetical protein